MGGIRMRAAGNKTGMIGPVRHLQLFIARRRGSRQPRLRSALVRRPVPKSCKPMRVPALTSPPPATGRCGLVFRAHEFVLYIRPFSFLRKH